MPDPSISPTSIPVGIDLTRASIARVYDAALGGKDNFEVDRELLRQLAEVAPQVNDILISNRQFLIRSLRWLAETAKVTQFLDCGSGLPTAENTHQVVQRIDPDSRVCYVDNDPVVIAHGRALLARNEHTIFIGADIFEPEEVLDHPEVRGFFDWSEPVALIHTATLHHYLGDDVPELMQTYVDGLVPGSYTVISHFLNPGDETHAAIAEKIEARFIGSPIKSGRFRTMDEIKAMFPDQEMIEPGVVVCDEWWPDGPREKPLNLVQECIAGGVGRKI